MALDRAAPINTNTDATVSAVVSVGSATSIKIADSSTTRTGLLIGTLKRDIFIKLQPAATDNDQKGIPLKKSDPPWALPANIYTGEVSAISNGGNADVYVTEY